MPLKTIKRSCCEKFGRFFVLDVLKTKFWMENLTQRWTQSGPSFFQNQSTFFDFQEKGRGGLCLPPLVAGLTIINASTAIYIYWNSLHLMHPKTPTMAYLCHRTWLKLGVYLQDRLSLWYNQFTCSSVWFTYISSKFSFFYQLLHSWNEIFMPHSKKPGDGFGWQFVR